MLEEPIDRPALTPGAAFGGFIWLVVSFGFRAYLHFFNDYSVSHGSLGAVMILLVWLYATGLACLIGAEISAAIERSSRNDNGILAESNRSSA